MRKNDKRGNSRDRSERRKWLLKTYAANKHIVIPIEGKFPKLVKACRCYRCGNLLSLKQITVDRIIPGCKGGTYRRNNIRPACLSCNSETGARLRWQR